MAQKKEQLNLVVSREEFQGFYSNLATFRHTEEEFIIDFFFVVEKEGKLVSRIISSPRHAKAILMALTENIAKYENKYGEIKIIPDKKLY